MKLKVFNSLFDVPIFLKVPIKYWKYMGIIWIILRIILQSTFYTIAPMVLLYIFLRIFINKDMRLVELLVNHYKDKNKYYNP